MPDGFFRIVNPANIDRYHAAIARSCTSERSAQPGRLDP